MEFDHSVFPFDRLPDDIQSRILSLLPITVLVVCKAVSPSWRSIIRSPSFTDSYRPSRDPIFLLYSKRFEPTDVCAYIPSTDRWIHFHFRFRFRARHQVSILPTTGTSLLLLKESGGRLSVVDPFSPPRRLQFLTRIPYLHRCYKFLAVIQDYPSDYTIVAVGPRDGAHIRIYDSRSRRWKGVAPSQVDNQCWGRNAVYLHGLLYCLSSHPNGVLIFDPVGGQWSMLDAHSPCHLFGFGGELYLTGGVRGGIGIRIWKLHWSEMAWKVFDSMPESYFAVFDACELSCLTITACAGMICFSTRDPKEIVMCDLAVRRWWCPKPYNMLVKRGFAIGSAIEPHINLLM